MYSIMDNTVLAKVLKCSYIVHYFKNSLPCSNYYIKKFKPNFSVINSNSNHQKRSKHLITT